MALQHYASVATERLGAPRLTKEEEKEAAAEEDAMRWRFGPQPARCPRCGHDQLTQLYLRFELAA